MPVSIFISETLLFLRLHRLLFCSLDSVSLPHLKTMRLEKNIYTNEAGLESLITSCPVLEDLIIVRRPADNVKVLRVRSQTLITLSIEFETADDEVEGMVVEFNYDNSEVLIDAPRLKYLTLDNERSESISISNSGSLTKLKIPNEFNLVDIADEVDIRKRSMIRNFFTSISGIRDMNISLAMIEWYINDMVPFCNLSCLEIELYVIDLEELPKVLEKCPNLKSLILKILYNQSSRLCLGVSCHRSSL